MATRSPGGNILEFLNKIYRSKNTSEEILKKLTSTLEIWGMLIKDNSLSQETAGIIIHLIASASKFESQSSRQNLQQILQAIVASSLLTKAGAKLLLGIRTDKKHQYICVLYDIFTIVKTLFLVMPHSLGNPQTIGLIELLHKQILSSNQLEECKTLLSEVSELKNDLMKTLTCKLKARNQENSLETLEDKMIPAWEFRNISVMPDENDLLFPTQFLRKNKEVGKYANLDDYLDVQFRLYREDCIAPLREAFEEFHFKAKENQHFRMENARIYRSVQIRKKTKISLDHGEVLEVALDKKHFSSICWKNSKRLIFGSLLLLSFDNFKTTYFAVVADSDRNMLQQNGCFTINLPRMFINQQIPREKKGIILEATSAYYEAYHHVLSALKAISDDTFPFKKYIVDCNRVIEPPKYLDTMDEIQYDLQPVISGGRIVLDHHKAKENVQEWRVPLWDTSHWPPSEVLNMDESQKQAFISALTKEFAIIQGPPGTGKTYIGLQIAKCLLHNSYQWTTQSREQERIKTPCLLVVCFTNHALDKFVEGIIDFLPQQKDNVTKNCIPDVIRIGSQCLNPKVDKYSLKNVRKKVQKRSPAFRIFRDAEDCKRTISMERAILKAINSHHFVLKLGELFKYIEVEHLASFDEHPDDSWEDWLHISLRSWFEEVQKKTKRKQRQATRNSNDGLYNADKESVFNDIDTEADYAYIERSVEDDDDTDFIFDCRSVIGVDLQKQLHDFLEGINDVKSEQMFYEEMKIVLNELKFGSVASEEMMNSHIDLWALSLSDRFKIYRYWLHKYVKNKETLIRQKEETFYNLFEDYKRARAEIDEEILNQTSVIALTTTGAAKYHESLKKIGPQMTIIEEAAEVPEAHVVTAINPRCKHIILIGDHKQLEPKSAVQELALKYNLSLSLFERMINNGLHYNCLQRQHRMRPEISELVRHMYPALDDNENVKKYENVKGVRKNLFFVTHEQEEQYNDDLKSYSNEHEAEFVKELCSYLLKQGYKGSEITIIAAYTSQMMLIRTKLPFHDFKGVTVCVLDNYQGEENEIVLLSLVRSNSKGEIGFLRKPNRICVALSRAKKGLYIIGNSTTLTKGSSEWITILAKIKSGDRNGCSFGKALPLYCQNHPMKDGIRAECSKDFSKVPDGGCVLPCEMRLKCGHACRYYCHPFDKDHESYKCLKLCYRRCKDGHTCNRRCHYSEQCNCSVKVQRVLSCSHSVRLKCFVDPSNYRCTVNMNRLLKCGHQVILSCHVDYRTYECQEIMKCERKDCGHDCERLCSDTDFEAYNKCEEIVKFERKDCGHGCERLCSDTDFEAINKCEELVEKSFGECSHTRTIRCCADLTSMKCSINVEKILQCGHKAIIPCYQRNNHKGCFEKCQRQCSNGHICDRECHFPSKCNCRIKIMKQLPNCGHEAHLACSENVNSFNRCSTAVDIQLNVCGHTAIVPCHKKNEMEQMSARDRTVMEKSLCVQQFEVELPRCGHMKNVLCSQSAALNNKRKYYVYRDFDYIEDILGIKCSKIVEYKFKCGHIVEQKCWKIYEYLTPPYTPKCSILVDTKLKCGHIHQLECSELNSFLNGLDNFTVLCKTMVDIQLKCGHTKQIECYERNNYLQNPEILKCKLTGDITLECVHKQCSSRFSNHPKCSLIVDLQLEECGHILKVECWQKSQYENKASRGTLNLKCDSKIQIPRKPCGHYKLVLCYQRSNEENTKCQAEVSYMYPQCGHEGKIYCYQQPKHKAYHKRDFVIKHCTFLVKKKLDCGHLRDVECYMSENAECLEICKQKLLCGHPCMGLCKDCHKNIAHKECEQICKRKLLCGHNCESQKCIKCKPCKQRCQFSCEHTACTLECVQRCKPCIKPCTWKCQHFKCTRLCWEICDRPLCSQNCEVILKCGHRCPGFCSEPCPVSCSACDSSKYHVSLGNENVKIVTIDSCGHSFDNQYLDTYIARSANDLVLRCPKCNAVFQKHPRYNELLKIKRNYIELMKEQTLISMKSSDCVFPKYDQEIFSQYIKYIVHFQKYLNVMTDVERKSDNLNDIPVLKRLCENLLQCLKNVEQDKCQNIVEIDFGVFRLHTLWVLRLCEQNDELLKTNFKRETFVNDLKIPLLKTLFLDDSRNERANDGDCDLNDRASVPEGQMKIDIPKHSFDKPFDSSFKEKTSDNCNEQIHFTGYKQLFDENLAQAQSTAIVVMEGSFPNSNQIAHVQDVISATFERDKVSGTITGQQIISILRDYMGENKHQEIKQLLNVLTPLIKDDMYYNLAMNYPKLTLIGVHDDDWKVCPKGHITPTVMNNDCLTCSGNGDRVYRNYDRENSKGNKLNTKGMKDAQTNKDVSDVNQPQKVKPYRKQKGRTNKRRGQNSSPNI